MGAGVEFERDVVVHPGAVAVMAVRDDGAVAVLRQYRATFDDVNWELPAGTRDVSGEDPVDTARRELAEETGLTATHLERLFTYMNSRGWTDQLTEVFLATGLTEGPRRTSGPEEDRSELHWLDPQAVEDLLARRQPMESSTIMGLMWLQGRRNRGVA